MAVAGVALPMNAPESSPPGGSRAARATVLLAVAAACTLGVLLGVRNLSSPDLGYHLAYGQRIVRGEMVDHNEFVFTLPPLDTPPADRPEPGPGCWYDDAGRYRFANANWLSQALFALVYQAGGTTGLCLLQAALMAGMVALALATMRRLGVGWLATAGGVLLLVLTAYERFTLRPEVPGYLLLAAELLVLVWSERLSWRRVALLAALQLALVNTHSYFLLGLALTGAFLADRLLRIAWARLRRAAPPDGARGDAVRLAVALGLQLAACFANPWTWRLAVLPVQTLLFLRKHRIMAGDVSDTGHPWSVIREVFRPFDEGSLVGLKATSAFVVALALGGLGAAAALVRRRWAAALTIAGLAFVGLSMRRNIAPAALIIVPLALGALCPLGAALAKIFPALRHPVPRIVASLAVVLSAGWFSAAVVTNRFYFAERTPNRFAFGLSRLNLPVGPAEWLNERLPHQDLGRHGRAENVWVDFTDSSNFYFLRAAGGNATDVPILTNTWAYPPDVMRNVLEINRAQAPFGPVAERYDIRIVVLRVDFASVGLARKLLADADWRLVYIEGLHTVFVRRELAEARRLPAVTPESLAAPGAMAACIARLREIDPVPAHTMYAAGWTLSALGWQTQALVLLHEATTLEPAFFEAWLEKGACYANRALARRSRDDLRQALACFTRAAELRPRDRRAAELRDRAQRDLAAW